MVTEPGRVGSHQTIRVGLSRRVKQAGRAEVGSDHTEQGRERTESDLRQTTRVGSTSATRHGGGFLFGASGQIVSG